MRDFDEDEQQEHQPVFDFEADKVSNIPLSFLGTLTG